MDKTIEIPKANWSGEKGTITLHDDGTFTIYDYRFRIVLDEPADPDMHLARVRSADGAWGSEFSMATGIKFKKDKNWMFISGSVERDHADPVIAAAQVLFNTI